MRSNWKESFKIKLTAVAAVITAMAVLGVGRFAAIATDSNITAKVNNYISVQLENSRGDFYDCNGLKLTGINDIYIIVFLPCDEAKVRFKELANSEELLVGERRFLNNKPAVLRRDFEVEGKGIFSYLSADRYENNLALSHIIGYVNSENKGVTGLEKTFDQELAGDGVTSAEFSINALGEYIIGAEPKLNINENNSKITLTIDRQIQYLCFGALDKVEKGAVVVTEIENGKIRAIVSKPCYDAERVADYLSSDNSPFLNRALCCYSVGSVFKPFIAAALIENGVDAFENNCTGSVDISGLPFHCYNLSGHGNIGLSKAIAYSCNTYFYGAVNLIEPNKYINLATALGFSSEIPLADGIVSRAGLLPDAKALQNKAASANFSIGQGDVLLTPLAINNLYTAIANDGSFFSPTIVESVREDGKTTKYTMGDKNVVMSKGTASQLKEYLSYVISFGTGKSAQPTLISAAGKTATAQTGKFKGETELINSWFCGFFPREEPKYSVTVFVEETTSEGLTAAPIFKNLADEVAKVKNMAKTGG